jgi:hypothetical protein
MLGPPQLTFAVQKRSEWPVERNLRHAVSTQEPAGAAVCEVGCMPVEPNHYSKSNRNTVQMDSGLSKCAYRHQEWRSKGVAGQSNEASGRILIEQIPT